MDLKFYKLLNGLLLLGIIAGGVCTDRGDQPTFSRESSRQIDDDGLPINLEERDQLLKNFYEEVIPLLIAAKPSLLPGTFFENMSLDWLNTPFPYNPYREPSIDKRFLIPGNYEELFQIITMVEIIESHHQDMIKAVQPFINGEPSQQIILKKDLNVVKNLLTFDKEACEQYKNIQTTFNKNEQISVTIAFDPLKKGLFIKFQDYHKRQLDKINKFKKPIQSVMNSIEDMDFKEKVLGAPAYLLKSRKDGLFKEFDTLRKKNETINTFFLQGRYRASDLIAVKFLEGKERPGAEVIVFDLPHTYSRHLNYKYPPDKFPLHMRKFPKESHSTAVAGILAGRDTLHQFQGVVPGARVITMEDLSEDMLRQIEYSTARVINISRGLDLPKKCAGFFNEEPAKQPNVTCSLFRKFVDLVKSKDMIVVSAIGNEGLYKERRNWKGRLENTNQTLKEKATTPAMGMQYENASSSNENKCDEDKVSLSEISHHIPQLKNRMVFVANLKFDGVTIEPSSSLPGAFSDETIFAPAGKDYSQTLFPMVIGYKKDKSAVWSEIGTFGGTSGATPRVSGIFVLLGQQFPDLPMTTIRQKVLDSGVSFWEKPNNKFTALKEAINHQGKIGEDYKKHLYGRGLINAEAAYKACLEAQDTLRQKGPSGLDLAAASKDIGQLINLGDLKGLIGKANLGTKIIFDQQNKVKKSILLFAMEHQQWEIVSYLLDQHADFTPEERARNTPLDKAVPSGNDVIVDTLLKLYPKDISYQNTQDQTPLLLATSLGLTSIVEKILKTAEGKATINMQDKNKDTPLHVAITKNRTKISELLIDNGADTTIQNMNEATPLWLAAFFSPLSVVKKILETEGGKTAINRAAQGGITPLFMAMQRGKEDSEIAEFLINQGASPIQK